MSNEQKEENMFDGIKEVIGNFNKAIEAQLPALNQEINQMIKTKCVDESKIENTLDTLLSLTMHGMCDDLFVQLLEYYKSVSVAGAEFYWNEYDKQNND